MRTCLSWNFTFDKRKNKLEKVLMSVLFPWSIRKISQTSCVKIISHLNIKYPNLSIYLHITVYTFRLFYIYYICYPGKINVNFILCELYDAIHSKNSHSNGHVYFSSCPYVYYRDVALVMRKYFIPHWLQVVQEILLIWTYSADIPCKLIFHVDASIMTNINSMLKKFI